MKRIDRLTEDERERFGVSELVVGRWPHLQKQQNTGDGVLLTADKKGTPVNGIHQGLVVFNHSDGHGRDGVRRRVTYTDNSAQLALGRHRDQIADEIADILGHKRPQVAAVHEQLISWSVLTERDPAALSRSLAIVAGNLSGVYSPLKVEAREKVLAAVSLKSRYPGREEEQFNPPAKALQLLAAMDRFDRRVAQLDVPITDANNSRSTALAYVGKEEASRRHNLEQRLLRGEWDGTKVRFFTMFDAQIRLHPATKVVNWLNRKVRANRYQGIAADDTAAALQALHLGRLLPLLEFPARFIKSRSQGKLAALDLSDFPRDELEDVRSIWQLIRIGHPEFESLVSDAREAYDDMLQEAASGDWSEAQRLAERYLFLLRYWFLPDRVGAHATAIKCWYSDPLRAPAKA